MGDSAAATGRSLRLFLVDGSPTGVITAELGGSTVKAVVSSRTSLPHLVAREESRRTGVYLLLGADAEEPDRPLAYVGEADVVSSRLAQHDNDKEKDFFHRVVLIVSKDENLTKAHARYLESRLIGAVDEARRAKLVNGTRPEPCQLPEADRADMERFLQEIHVLLPILGFDILRPAGRRDHAVGSSPAIGTHNASLVEEIFVFRESGTNAKGREDGDEFIVLAGSVAKKNEVQSCGEGIKRERLRLMEEGKIIPATDPNFLTFKYDVAFNSSSGAASVIYGGNVSGPQYWKHVSTGQAYGEWRKTRIASSASGSQ